MHLIWCSRLSSYYQFWKTMLFYWTLYSKYPDKTMYHDFTKKAISRRKLFQLITKRIL